MKHSRTHRSHRRRLDHHAADRLPADLAVHHGLQDRAAGDRGAAAAVLHADAGELRRGAGAQRLHAVRQELDDHQRAVDAARPGDRGTGGLLDGLLPDQAHARHPDVDAVDQDDAGGRRAGADLRAGAERRHARLADRPDHRLHAVEPADHGVDAVLGLQGHPARHPRGRAHGRRHRLGRVHARDPPAGDGAAGLDRAAVPGADAGTRPSGRST